MVNVNPGGQSGTATTTAPRGPRDTQPPQRFTPRRVTGRAVAPSPVGQAQINAREAGSTAGVVQTGRQPVFASSTAPARASKATPAKSKARASARSAASAPSERTATADIWSGVRPGGGPSMASAAALGGDSGGLSGGMVAAIAVLGLGLAGIGGGALVTGRRRRAAARGGAPDRQ